MLAAAQPTSPTDRAADAAPVDVSRRAGDTLHTQDRDVVRRRATATMIAHLPAQEALESGRSDDGMRRSHQLENIQPRTYIGMVAGASNNG